MRAPLVSVSPTIARINVTPIIDVALVLVIILLFTAPMLSVANMDIQLPVAEARGAEDPLFISISVGMNGETAIDDKPIDRSELVERLSARLATSPEGGVLVVVRADTNMPHREVRAVLDDARAAGAERLAVATRQDVSVK